MAVKLALNHIFNEDQLEEMSYSVGSSVMFTRLFTEVCKQMSAEQTFMELLQLNDPYFSQVKTEFQHRLNKLYVHPKLGQHLDDGSIDFVLMQVLEQLIRYPDEAFSANSDFCRNELLVSDVFEALFDNNIIFKQKYYEVFHVEHRLYIEVIRSWLMERK
jgi:hypothetical protein